MKRKWLTIVLAASLSISMSMAGCGNKSKDSSTSAYFDFISTSEEQNSNNHDDAGNDSYEDNTESEIGGLVNDRAEVDESESNNSSSEDIISDINSVQDLLPDIAYSMPNYRFDVINDAEKTEWDKVFDTTDGGIYEDNPNDYMAHNIYIDPDLNGTSGKYSGFLIDFKADYQGLQTYWALCNWSLDLSSLNKDGYVANGGGAYAGLQNRVDGTKAIMSFWQIEYNDTIIVPTLIYPVMNGNGNFDNEGSGSNYITSFSWDAQKWYRMYINCYDDENIGNTVVEMWIQDIESGIWTEICSYDTKLKNSGLIGGMSQFMENFDSRYATELRSCEFANIYVREHGNNEWMRINNGTISIDTWYGNKKGSYSFGSTSNTVWGITCGYGDDVAAPNSSISSYESF